MASANDIEATDLPLGENSKDMFLVVVGVVMSILCGEDDRLL